MGGLKLQSGIKAMEEEPEDCECRSSRGALACTVNSEIGAVLAVMRRNVRWGGRYISGSDQLEHSLIQSLKSLRKQIFQWQKHWNTINPVVYLTPFLDVVKSDETGAPITGVALSSIYKILSLDVIDVHTVNAEDAMHLVVDAVTSCRFEVTDPASEEVVLMKILQVLLACMKSKAAILLSNQHVCTIVNTCFRVVHQAGAKGELLQRIARHTMHELIRCIFSRLPNIDNMEHSLANGEFGKIEREYNPASEQLDNGNNSIEYSIVGNMGSVNSVGTTNEETSQTDQLLMTKPFGVPCMVEIFHFLCSLLNIIEHNERGSRSNTIAYDEDVPLFALGLINSVIELGGHSISQHPKLLSLIQDELFLNLMEFGKSTSSLILSMVCSITLNLYYHLRTELKLQLEAFFSCVISKLAESRFGASYQQQEVAMEALVDFCRQDTFMAEMYVNLDCDITCNNVFEDLVNLLSKSAFPVNCPLSAIHTLAMDGLISMVQGMAERLGNRDPISEQVLVDFEEYTPFWNSKCENIADPNHWVPFVRRRKYIKRRLMTGVDHFNRDRKKGLEFAQETHLLPEKLDPHSVACFFRYTNGLDKNLLGEYLGNHDEFSVKVLHEFAATFDFQDLNLDIALRLFLETFRLPGEAQKIQRVLEAFSERYYEQSPHVLANKDAALVLSYSIIMLNTDQHNIQVKKKMTEEDFIRNNRSINGGNDLPREFLSELYHSICMNEIRTIPDQTIAFPEMTPSRWIDLMRKSKKTSPFIVCDSTAFLDLDMFSIISGPTIAAISVVFDNAEQEDVFQACIDGFLAIAKVSASYHLHEVLDDLVVSICKFTTLLNPSSFEDSLLAFSDDTKARMATVAVFTIANDYGSYIRSGWRNILDCVLKLHKLGLLPSFITDDPEISSTKPISIPSVENPQKSYGLMGRFSQLLYLDTEEPKPKPKSKSQPTEEELEVVQHTLNTIQECHIDTIFTESTFLHADSLLELARALIYAAERPQRSKTYPEDEDISVFCLELLITITLNNRDRILLLWGSVYEHICSIVQSTVMPCALVEKAVFGLLRICQRLLPYKENLADELLRSLQLVLKLDARVADAYCENITQEVTALVKANAMHIRSQSGWRTISSLLSITARHPEASESGFEALTFIMTDGVHLSPANYTLCVDAARQFAESRVGNTDRSLSSLDLMAGSIDCLSRWSKEVDEEKVGEDIREMWVRLVQGVKRVCLDRREEVRNHAVFILQRCLMGVDGVIFPDSLWMKSFDLVIFNLMDDLLEIAQDHSPKEYRNMEGTLVLAVKMFTKIFLQVLPNIYKVGEFSDVWVGVLSRMEKYMKVKVRGKRSEKLQELVPELLKNTLFVMRTRGVLVQSGGDDNKLWELTWLHVKTIAPSLKEDVFPENLQQEESVVEGEGSKT